jgi:hypothetical protein
MTTVPMTHLVRTERHTFFVMQQDIPLCTERHTAEAALRVLDRPLRATVTQCWDAATATFVPVDAVLCSNCKGKGWIAQGGDATRAITCPCQGF